MNPNSNSFRVLVLAFVGLVSLAMSAPASAKIRVVTTTPTLADIASRVGGDEVDVESLMSSVANAHNVIPKPSFVIKLRKADLFVHSGLDGEPWVPNLLRSARKPDLLPGGPANLDASIGIPLLEVPDRNSLTRAMGDIHVFGNPHYLLDPSNGARVGHTIATALAGLAPRHAKTFEANANALEAEMTALTAKLAEDVKSIGLCPVVTYHRTWSYFLARFSISKLADLEPKPGISSGPRHISELADAMKRTGARLVLSTTFDDPRSSSRLADAVGGRHVVLAHEVGARPGAEHYPALFQFNVHALAEAARSLPQREGRCP